MVEAVESGDAETIRSIMNSYPKTVWIDLVKNNNLIFRAIESGHDGVLSVLSEEDLNVLIHRNSEGKTALHAAIHCKNIEAAKEIIGINKNTLLEKDCDGNTPLHCMVKNRLKDMFDAAKNDLTPKIIDAMNSQNLTSVHLAARERADGILEILINKEGNVTAKTGKKWTPLHYAADSGSEACVKLLLNAVVDEKKKVEYKNSTTTSEKYTALMYAARKGFTSCCRALSGTDPDIAGSVGQTALHLAAKKGFSSLLIHLVKDEHAQPHVIDANRHTPLHHSILSNSEECFKFLLDLEDQQVDSDLIQELLKLVVEKNSYRCLNVMLERKEFADNINHQFAGDKNNTLLHLSARKGNYKTTQKLLEKGAEKAIKNNDNEYPLHLMARQSSAKNRSLEEERLEVCKDMLRESHDLVDKLDKDGRNPLMLAAKSGNLEMVRSLLHKGSKALQQDDIGETAVHFAIEAGNDQCLKSLLRFMTTAENKSLDVDYPHLLHLAAEKGHLSCCQMLLAVSDIKWDSFHVQYCLNRIVNGNYILSY